jgi:putative tricarboxylic transport membrane protein
MPGDFSLYTAGLSNTLQFDVLMILFFGTLIGVIFGVIPGLSPVIGVSILIPFTFKMDTIPSFALLLGMYCGSMFGGSISAIIANIPGTSAAIMTVQDGYPLAQRGEAGRAIGIATISSFIGGVISVFILAFFAPIIAAWALELSAPEFFAVAVFGISVIAYVSSGTMVKGFLGAVIGLLLSTVGVDEVSGYPRFTFETNVLLGGLPLIPLMVGLFGFAEVLRIAEKGIAGYQKIVGVGRILPSLGDLRRLLGSILRGSAIGVFIGAVPATGGTIAAIVSYGVEKRLSKHPETFGKGEPQGISAPESANNASTGGAMIPMLTLGIPGDIVTALLIAAFIIHGLFPGPLLFRNNPEVVSSIFISLMFSNFMFLGLGLMGAKYFAKLVTLPRGLLVAMILCLSIVGTYSIQNSVFDVWVYVAAGIAGFYLTKVGVPVSPIVIGFVLGSILESYFRQGLIMSFGDPLEFVTRPIAATFLGLTVLLIFSPLIVEKILGKGRKS